MAKHTVGLVEVANAAGVSTTTVHRALRGTGRISEATRNRILEVAQSLGYRPNHAARSLRTRHTATLGVVFGSLGVSFFAELLAAVESTARESGYSTLIAVSDASPDKERERVDLLLEKGAEGLLVSPTDPEINRDYYRDLLAQQVPLVFVDCFIPGLAVGSVSTDNERGGYLAGRHLLAAGRQRLALLDYPPRSRVLTSVQGRWDGFGRALAEAGLPAPALIGSDLPGTVPSEEYGYASMCDFLDQGGELDGCFVVHDALAYGAMAALREHGVRLPEDVALVGFDDLAPSGYTFPPLTSVRQPVERLGREAIGLLTRILTAPFGGPPPQILLEPTLTIRRSCGEPPS
ncbi:MAG TPA: LacI family DNA-binding transcriptional regulator [Armatimonadota bacterium]|jgi:LacI family transcriptional regulator